MKCCCFRNMQICSSESEILCQKTHSSNSWFCRNIYLYLFYYNAFSSYISLLSKCLKKWQSISMTLHWKLCHYLQYKHYKNKKREKECFMQCVKKTSSYNKSNSKNKTSLLKKIIHKCINCYLIRFSKVFQIYIYNA